MYIIIFFTYMRRWGFQLRHRIELMRDRTTSAYSRERNKSASARKKTAAMNKFSNFLRNETIVATLWIIEQLAFMVLKERDLISLQTTPLIIFAMKVVQRLTEWLMVSRILILAPSPACALHHKITNSFLTDNN